MDLEMAFINVYLMILLASNIDCQYSEIPLLRPPKMKTFYPLKTLFAKFK